MIDRTIACRFDRNTDRVTRTLEAPLSWAM
jgi:hypothetical protein